MDLWEVDVARFDRAAASRSFLAQRMKETVSDQFAMHWPYKQAKAGRGARRSPLHEAFAEAGAVFGAPAGWERPLWFAADEAEREMALQLRRPVLVAGGRPRGAGPARGGRASRADALHQDRRRRPRRARTAAAALRQRHRCCRRAAPSTPRC